MTNIIARISIEVVAFGIWLCPYKELREIMKKSLDDGLNKYLREELYEN